MLKKRILSAVTAVCMSASMFVSVANAAVESLAPWSLYFTPQWEHYNFEAWTPADIQRFDEGNVYISKVVGNSVTDVHLAAEPAGENRFKVGSDAQGYNGAYGSVAIGFDAPVTGDYEVEFYAKNMEGLTYHNAAYSMLGVLNTETNTIEQIRADGLHGNAIADEPDAYVEYTQVVSLDAGEKMTMKFWSATDAYCRMFRLRYKITDLTSGKVYDFNKAGKDAVVPVAVEESNVYDLSDYYLSNAVDNSMWSLWFAPDAQGSAWTDMNTWVAKSIEENRDAATRRVSVSSGTASFTIYDNRPDGWFNWRPEGDAASQGTGTAVIGWTAPEAGDYYFDFEIFNMGTDVRGDDTFHRIASLKAGETTPVSVSTFNMPGSSKQELGSKKIQLKVEAGETIFLMNDANVDGWGDSAVIRYEITNIADASKTWSVSDIGKTYELTNSPYSLWTSYHNWGTVTTDLTQYIPAVIDYQADNEQSVTNKWQVPYFMVRANGTFEAIPSGTAGYNNAVMFDVPKDGFYKVEFTGTNTNSEADAPANGYAALYKITGRDTTIGNQLANSGGLVQNDYKYFAHTVQATAGDKLLLNLNTNSDAYKLRMGGKYRITRLEKVNYGLVQNNIFVKDFAELKAGSTLTATVDYLDDAATSVQAVVAFYDVNGNMKAYGVSDAVTTTAGTPSTISAEVTVPEITEGMYVKVMAVEDLNTLVPLSAPYVLK